MQTQCSLWGLAHERGILSLPLPRLLVLSFQVCKMGRVLADPLPSIEAFVNHCVGKGCSLGWVGWSGALAVPGARGSCRPLHAGSAPQVLVSPFVLHPSPHFPHPWSLESFQRKVCSMESRLGRNCCHGKASSGAGHEHAALSHADASVSCLCHSPPCDPSPASSVPEPPPLELGSNSCTYPRCCCKDQIEWAFGKCCHTPGSKAFQRPPSSWSVTSDTLFNLSDFLFFYFSFFAVRIRVG